MKKGWSIIIVGVKFTARNIETMLPKDSKPGGKMVEIIFVRLYMIAFVDLG